MTVISGLFRGLSFTVAALLGMVLFHGQFMFLEHVPAACKGISFLPALTGLVFLARPTVAIDSYFD